MNRRLPGTQYAVQLVGPDELMLNKAKKITPPGPHQILARVEAVGLCFSDLKLLKQFSRHVRKSGIVSGIETNILEEIPSYVPDDAATVPGHEAVVRIWAVGEKVKDFQPGRRFLVQTDYRWLATANSNAAFGYNFEGALQEYVLMDQRVITSPQGQSMLIPASDELSAAAVALVEPWACVENAYAVQERTTIKTHGKMLVVADGDVEQENFLRFLDRFGRPAGITWIGPAVSTDKLDIPLTVVDDISVLEDAAYDDVIYFGSKPETVESLFTKPANGGLFNIVLCGGRLRRDVLSYIGRVHYGGIRIIGTVTCDPADAMKSIPSTGEIRNGNRINVIGAGGPMGLMHVVRNICQGVSNISVFAGDLDEKRLEILNTIAQPAAQKNKINYCSYNPSSNSINEDFDYIVLMVPVPALIQSSMKNAADGAIINIFAGIPAQVTAPIDLQTYIEKRMYFIGTSGSVLDDMETVLQKVESGRLDTNLSVAAVAGLDGAVEGIGALEKQLIPGKIIVYPSCKGLGLLRLNELKEKIPAISPLLESGCWSRQAETKLLEIFHERQV